jgi:hypothetical protein
MILVIQDSLATLISAQNHLATNWKSFQPLYFMWNKEINSTRIFTAYTFIKKEATLPDDFFDSYFDCGLVTIPLIIKSEVPLDTKDELPKKRTVKKKDEELEDIDTEKDLKLIPLREHPAAQYNFT